jgi:hypothetical protein
MSELRGKGWNDGIKMNGNEIQSEKGEQKDESRC